MKPMIGLLILVLYADSLSAQEVVRLKSGRTISGRIEPEQDRSEGFRIRLWETRGVVFVSWTQVPPAEKNRLLHRESKVDSQTLGNLLDGVRILTKTREIIGLLAGEDAQSVKVKTADRRSPAAIPRVAILERTAAKVRESDVWSALERVQRRAEDVDEGDAGAWMEVAIFAEGVGEYWIAKEYYEKAKEADPARAEEIGGEIERITLQIREADAKKALAAVRELADAVKFEEALTALDEFLREYSDTDTAEKNAKIEDSIREEYQNFQANRDKILGGRIGKSWPKIRRSLLRKYAGRRTDLPTAQGLAEGLDEVIKENLAKKLNIPSDQVKDYWINRERKQRKADYGTGSWIALGGQDGGYDYEGSPESKEDGDAVDDFRRRFGGRNSRGRGKGKPERNPNKKMQTSEDWWKRASSSKRVNWLEAYYAENSSVAEPIKREEKKCSTCRGQGNLNSTRYGESVSVLCRRCHGVKSDITVTYR